MSDAGKVWVVDPTTGQPSQVDAEAAQQGFVGGKLQLPADSEVKVVAQDGTIMSAPAANAAKALQSGWRFAGAADVLKHEAENQPLQAFAEAALNELTMGGSDAVAQHVLGVEGLKERRETAAGQTGSWAGLGAGVFGPGLLEGALAAGRKGIAISAAEAALAPMRAVNAAGNAVEQAASRALGGALENQAAARAVAAGLGRGVEGAVIGAGGALSEEALGNPDANAEQLMAAIGGGALLGFGVGGAFGSGLRGLGDGLEARAYKAARQKQLSSVGARGWTADEAANALAGAEGGLPEDVQKGVRGWLGQKLKEGAVALGGQDPEDLDKLYGKMGQQVLREGNKAVEDVGRKMASALDGLAGAQKASNELAYGDAKQELLEKLVPKGASSEVVSGAGRAIEGVRGVLDSIERDAVRNGLGDQGAKIVQNFRLAVDEAENRLFGKAGIPVEVSEKRVVQQPFYDRDTILAARNADADLAHARTMRQWEEAGSEGAPPIRKAPTTDDLPLSISREETSVRRRKLQDIGDGAFNVPDSFGRDVYNELNHLKQVFEKPGRFGVELPDAAQRELRNQFREAYGALRAHLEDEAVWGGAAKLQKDINGAFSARAQAWDELQNHFKFYESGKELRVDPASVASYLGKVERLRGDRAVEALDNWQAANRKFSDVLEKNFGSGLQTAARDVDKQLTVLRKDLSQKIEVFAALRRVLGRSQQQFGFGGNGGVYAGALLGALGPLGAAGAVVGEGLLNPGRFALVRANISGVLDRTRKHIDARLENLITGAKRAVPSLPTSSRLVSRATTKMLEAKSPEERRKAYEKRVNEVMALSNPQTFGDHVAQQTLGLSAAVPAHTDALTNQAAAALAILQASFPQARPGANGGILDQDAKPVPHDRDILRFAETDHALQAPVDALFTHAERGHIPQHVVKAIEQAYPQLMQGVRFAAADKAGKIRGRAPMLRSRVVQQLMGGQPVTPAQLASYQAVHEAPQRLNAAPQAAPKASPTSQALATSTDKLDSIYSK